MYNIFIYPQHLIHKRFSEFCFKARKMADYTKFCRLFEPGTAQKWTQKCAFLSPNRDFVREFRSVVEINYLLTQLVLTLKVYSATNLWVFRAKS